MYQSETYQSETEKLPTEAQLALQSGRRKEAVAIVQQQTELGPSEARDLVDRVERANRSEGFDVPPQAQGREDSGVLRLVVIVAVLGALAAAAFLLL